MVHWNKDLQIVNLVNQLLSEDTGQKQLRKNYIISFGSPIEACNIAYSIAVYDSFLFLQQWAIIFSWY